MVVDGKLQKAKKVKLSGARRKEVLKQTEKQKEIVERVTKTTGDVLYAKPRVDSDECMTPRYLVIPIVKYILWYERNLGRSVKVWLPFDTKDSEFVKVFTEVGIDFEASHIKDGKDFFTYQPDSWDIIVSNPPFKKKKEFFDRALSFNKPFALVMAMTWLNDATVYKLFSGYGKDLQILSFDKRTHFLNDKGEDMGRPSFGSSYFCSDLLPKQIVYETLDKGVK